MFAAYVVFCFLSLVWYLRWVFLQFGILCSFVVVFCDFVVCLVFALFALNLLFRLLDCCLVLLYLHGLFSSVCVFGVFGWLFTYLILLYLWCAFGRYYFGFISFALLLRVCYVFGVVLVMVDVWFSYGCLGLVVGVFIGFFCFFCIVELLDFWVYYRCIALS